MIKLHDLYQFMVDNYGDLGLETDKNIHYSEEKIHLNDGRLTNGFNCHIYIKEADGRRLLCVYFNNVVKRIPINELWKDRFKYTMNNLIKRFSYKIDSGSPMNSEPMFGTM